MKQQDIHTPYYFYQGSWSQGQHREERQQQQQQEQHERENQQAQAQAQAARRLGQAHVSSWNRTTTTTSNPSIIPSSVLDMVSSNNHYSTMVDAPTSTSIFVRHNHHHRHDDDKHNNNSHNLYPMDQHSSRFCQYLYNSNEEEKDQGEWIIQHQERIKQQQERNLRVLHILEEVEDILDDDLFEDEDGMNCFFFQ